MFQDSIEYAVYAASSSLFDGDKFPDTFKSQILQSSTRGDLSISEAVIYTINTDLHARARALLRYAGREYVRGFPKTNRVFINVSNPSLSAAIERDIGEPVTIKWKGMNSNQEDILIFKYIQETYTTDKYFPWGDAPPPEEPWDENSETVPIPVVNPDTGTWYEATNPPSYVRGFKDTTAIYEDPRDYTPPPGGQVLIGDPTARYEVTFHYLDNLGQEATWEVAHTYSTGKYATGNWIFAKFSRESTPDHTEYFTYLLGSGVDPQLEDAAEIDVRNASYYPVAIMMQDKVWFNEDPESPLAKTTNKLLKKFAMKGDKIREDFEEQEAEDDASGDSKKSKAEKYDFFIHFAVPIHTSHNASISYLHLFFIDQMQGSFTTFEEYQTYLASFNGNTNPKRSKYGLPQPMEELHISEDAQRGYNVAYRWSYIHKETYPGQFIDEHGNPLKRHKAHMAMYERKKDNDAEYKIGLEEIHGTGILFGVYGKNSERSGYHDYIIITRQYHDEELDIWHYERVLVMGLSMRYLVNTSEQLTQIYYYQYATPQLFGLEEETKEFRIPLNQAVMKLLPVLHREEVIADSFTGTVILVEKIKVPWYQNTYMKWLIVIITIIIIVVFWQYQFLPELAAAAGAATGAAGMGLWALFYVLSFALGFIISFAGNLIGSIAGQLFTLIGSYFAMGGGASVKSAWSGMTTNPSWGSAATLITTIEPYISQGLNIRNMYALAGLESDMRDFLLGIEERQQQLQDAWDSMGEMPSWLDPMDLVNMYRNDYPYENSEEYYSRTLNTNPGLIGYDLVTHFPQIALKLPKSGESNPLDKMFETFRQQRGDT